MEVVPFTIEYLTHLGFYPSQSSFGNIIPGTVISGSGVWFRGHGKPISDRGYSSQGATGGVFPVMVTGSTHAGLTGGGTVTDAFATTWFAGSGTAYKGGSPLGASAGSLMLMVGGSAVTAGLSKPSAPSFAVSATTSSKFTGGSWSVAVTAYRSTTGAESTRSNPSGVISASNKKGTITFPAAPSGATHWLIYGSRRAFGSVGPWFRVSSISPIAVGTATAEIDWFDGELTDLAPLTNDPPPACTHCANLGGVMIVFTSTGEIYPSKVGQPEAYDITQRSNLASREAITGVTARGVNGGLIAATRNSLSLVMLTGSDLTPVIPRGVWPDIGFAHGNAFCVVEDGQIYGMSGQRGLVRTQGDAAPDSTWAIPVETYLGDNGFTSDNTTVVYDALNDAVLVASGSVALPYMRKSGTWSTPIPLPGSANGGVALAGRGLIQVGGTLYALDAAGGGGAAQFQTPYYSGARGYERRFHTIDHLEVDADHAWTADLISSASGASLGGTKLPLAVTPPHTRTQLYRQFFGGVALKASTTGGGKIFNSAQVDGFTDPTLHP